MLKKILDKLKLNNQEGSMSWKFFKWFSKKDKKKCEVCGKKLIDSEFSENLCWTCFYDKLMKGEKI